jgi:hypothetical protein
VSRVLSIVVLPNVTFRSDRGPHTNDFVRRYGTLVQIGDLIGFFIDSCPD